ncbi:hypothetical protein [Rugamonas fusca]|nr:hypothetical protein [Rugamonas fusca]
MWIVFYFCPCFSLLSSTLSGNAKAGKSRRKQKKIGAKIEALPQGAGMAQGVPVVPISAWLEITMKEVWVFRFP